MKQENLPTQENYGRLAFNMVHEVKNQLKNELQKEVFSFKELFYTGKFTSGTWQTTFDGLADTFVKITFVLHGSTAEVLFNLNGVNVYKSKTYGTSISFDLPILSKNTLVITCNESEQPFKVYILGNLVKEKETHPTTLLENDGNLDFVYYNNGYKHSIITSAQEIFDDNLPFTPLPHEVLNVGYRLRSAPSVIIQDLAVLFKEDNYLKITLKSTNFQQKQTISGYNIAEKAGIIPIIHSRYAYQISHFKNNTLSSLYLDANCNILRTIKHNINLQYPITSIGGYIYKPGSLYNINGFWVINSNNDAYALVARNFSRTSTVFSYHDSAFSLGKAESLRIYCDGLTLTCFKKYKHSVTILKFQISVANSLNCFQLVKKESYNCSDDGFYLFNKHLLKYRELFTEITPE